MRDLSVAIQEGACVSVRSSQVEDGMWTPLFSWNKELSGVEISSLLLGKAGRPLAIGFHEKGLWRGIGKGAETGMGVPWERTY